MARKKSEINSVKTSKRMSVNQPKEKLNCSKKPTISKEAETFDGVDSLLFLKDTKERKKLNDIDGRIMLLKSELKSLMDSPKSDKACDIQGGISKVNQIERPKQLESKKVPENLRSLRECVTDKSKEFKPSSGSTTSKFTEWLDNAINETKSQCQSEARTSCEMSNSALTSEVQVEESTSNRFSQNKVEELLYKSFIVQNGLEDLPGTSTTKNTRLKRKINHEKSNKSEETRQKPRSVRSVQGKNKQLRVSRRGRKKRIISTYNNSDSDVEVIDLDNTMVENGGSRTEPSFIDLELSNYDWSEPFDVDDHCESVQIINESETEDDPVSRKQPKENSLEHTQETERKQNEDNENGDNEKPQAKKLWECPVCLEQSKGQEIVATQCGHIFCKTCLEHHILKVKNNCPTCRADLKNKPVITLFNF